MMPDFHTSPKSEAMPLLSIRHVFVYGTLRRGEQRDINHLLPQPRWRGLFSVSGLLYDLGTYPGLVLGGQGRVWGEVYEISSELERQLDEIEEVWPQPSGEYAKREVVVRFDAAAVWPACAVQPAEPETVICLVYEVAAEHASGKPVIANGDWVAYRASKPANSLMKCKPDK